MRGLISISGLALVLGQHIRVGNEDNIWGADRKRATSVKQIEGVVRIAKEFGRKIATAEEARKIMKVGVWYNSVEETLKHLGLAPEPHGIRPRLPALGDGRKTEGRSGGKRLAPYCLLHGAAGPRHAQENQSSLTSSSTRSRHGRDLVDEFSRDSFRRL